MSYRVPIGMRWLILRLRPGKAEWDLYREFPDEAAAKRRLKELRDRDECDEIVYRIVRHEMYAAVN